MVSNAEGIKEQSDIIQVNQPDPLEATLNSSYSGCGTAKDWTVTTSVSGGTSPYFYSWNTGETKSSITNVEASNYLVFITDSQGCQIMKTESIKIPEVVNVIGKLTQVNCKDACEGAINLTITGGVLPYAIQWSTGETTLSINKLCPNNYSAEVTDAKGCKISQQFTIVNPSPIVLNLGNDITLCTGQSCTLNIDNKEIGTTYQWTATNGFSSTASTVNLTQAGIYTATFTNRLGCIGTDSIEIKQSNAAINSQFLIASHAFANTDIVLINTSNPLSKEVKWILPKEAKIINESNETITIRFENPGVYDVILRSFQGDCSQDYSKSLIVGEARDLPDIGDAITPFISEFIIIPNPSQGVFEVAIKLQDTAAVSLRLFSLLSSIPIDDRQANNEKNYKFGYNVNLASGIYFILLETAKGSEIRKIIIRP